MAWSDIEILSTAADSSSPRRSWTVHVINGATGHKSSPFTLEDPFSEPEYENLRWYMEDYAAKDPFSSGRAERVAGSLTNYGQRLITTILPFIDYATRAGDSDLPIPIRLYIRGDGTQLSLHVLHWELIERAGGSGLPYTFSIRRIPDNQSISKQTVYHRQGGTDLRILYVAARPSLENDIAYRAISRQIWGFTKATVGKPKICLDFVRPGTWKNFQDTLKRHEVGYYDAVHFDMHGSIRRRGQHRAVLSFASYGAASTKPDNKGATLVAKLLAAHGVRSAVLNACNSATPSPDVGGNLAYLFASHGVSHVVAMVYKIKTDAAVLAMRAIYSAIPDGWHIPNFARHARETLRNDRLRCGRYGALIPCEDDFNLVCYSSNTALHLDEEASRINSPNVLSPRLLAAQFPSKNPEDPHDIRGSATPMVSRVQDLDMLSLEELLQFHHIIFLCGESGTGKSTLARLLQQWWTETSFAREVCYFENHEALEVWLQDRQHQGSPSSENGTEKYCANTNKAPHSGQGNHDAIILIDNLESWGRLSREAGGSRHWHTLLSNTIAKQESMVLKFRMVVFTRLCEESLESIGLDVVCHTISPPTPGEATSVAIGYMSSTEHADAHTQEEAAELADIISQHDNNFNFIHTFTPLLGKLGCSPYQALEQVLGDPALCDVEYLRDLTSFLRYNSAFKSAHESIQSWPRNTDLSFRMILSFCVFTGTIPVDPRLWLFKCFETGVFSGGKRSSDAYPVESGRIRYYELQDGWMDFPPDWTFEKSWTKIKDLLASLGLFRQSEGMAQTNALLPYFLRYELSTLKGTIHNWDTYWILMQRAYWEYSEVYACDLIRLYLEDTGQRLAVVATVNNEISNIIEGIRLSIRQPIFPFRFMRSYYLLAWVNYTSMTLPRLKGISSLLSQVLLRFEQIITNTEWAVDQAGEKQPAEETRQKIFENAIQTARCLGRIYEALNDQESVIANSERVQRLKGLFGPLLDIDAAKIFDTSYELDIQKAKAKAISTNDWIPADLEYFCQLLTSETPNRAIEWSEGGGLARLAKASFVIHLSAEMDKIPHTHALRGLVEENFQESFQFLSSIQVQHMGLSRLQPMATRLALASMSASGSSAGTPNLFQKFTSRDQAAAISEKMQKAFPAQSLSNSPAFVADAIAYVLDPQAVRSGSQFVFDRERLREVYEISQELQNAHIQALCLQQLTISSIIDGDKSAADSYAATWYNLNGRLPGTPQILSVNLQDQRAFSNFLRKRLRELESGLEVVAPAKSELSGS